MPFVRVQDIWRGGVNGFSWPMATYVVVAWDERREMGLKSIVRAFTPDHAREYFLATYQPPRFSVDEVREVTDFELSETLSDGSSLREMIDVAGVGELVWTVDLA